MKKIVLVLSAILLALIVCIYCIGGSMGPYLWTLAIFIFAPAAILTLFIQIFALVLKAKTKKNVTWNVILLVLTLIYALPITVVFGRSPLHYPKNASKKDSIAITLPVKDGIVFDSDDDKSLALWPSECYSYTVKKEPYKIDSTTLTDYGIYGADVVSPVNGTVIDIISKEADTEIGSTKYASVLGNYIFIKIDETNTYLLLSHLKQDSIKVAIGDHLTEGMPIAQVGNSGASDAPHLHIQHQRNNPIKTTMSTLSEGLPITIK